MDSILKNSSSSDDTCFPYPSLNEGGIKKKIFIFLFYLHITFILCIFVVDN